MRSESSCRGRGARCDRGRRRPSRATPRRRGGARAARGRWRARRGTSARRRRRRPRARPSAPATTRGVGPRPRSAQQRRALVHVEDGVHVLRERECDHPVVGRDRRDRRRVLARRGTTRTDSRPRWRQRGRRTRRARAARRRATGRARRGRRSRPSRSVTRRLACAVAVLESRCSSASCRRSAARRSRAVPSTPVSAPACRGRASSARLAARRGERRRGVRGDLVAEVVEQRLWRVAAPGGEDAPGRMRAEPLRQHRGRCRRSRGRRSSPPRRCPAAASSGCAAAGVVRGSPRGLLHQGERLLAAGGIVGPVDRLAAADEDGKGGRHRASAVPRRPLGCQDRGAVRHGWPTSHVGRWSRPAAAQPFQLST